MYIFLENKNFCWDNNDKKVFFSLFLTKPLVFGTRPISEIQIIFPMSRAWGFFSLIFLILVYYFSYYIMCYVCLRNRNLWFDQTQPEPLETGILI